MQKYPANNINRIFDANINRAKEGLRVCEEITRFILKSRSLTSGLKDCRHRIDGVIKKIPSSSKFLMMRESSHDVGKNIYINELKRGDIQDIFFANMQRVKESVRVLEEFSKLKNKYCAIQFKNLRYRIYGIEKKTAKKISALSNP